MYDFYFLVCAYIVAKPYVESSVQLCSELNWLKYFAVVSLVGAWEFFFVVAEGKLNLKVYSVGKSDYMSVQVFSEEDGSSTGRIFIAVIVSTFSFL